MHVTRAAAAMLLPFMLAMPATTVAQAADPVGDPARGKAVFRSVGDCMRCHGWAADGRSGVHLRAPPGSNLRETALDAEGLAEVIRCGLPGTPMPYHSRQAYDGDGCYGMSLDDFDADDKPKRGKTFGDEDIQNVVAYLQSEVIGLGKPTFEECTAFFENPAAAACNSLR